MYIKKDVIEVIKYAAMDDGGLLSPVLGNLPHEPGLQGHALPWRLSPRRRSLPSLTEQE